MDWDNDNNYNWDFFGIAIAGVAIIVAIIGLGYFGYFAYQKYVEKTTQDNNKTEKIEEKRVELPKNQYVFISCKSKTRYANEGKVFRLEISYEYDNDEYDRYTKTIYVGFKRWDILEQIKLKKQFYNIYDNILNYKIQNNVIWIKTFDIVNGSVYEIEYKITKNKVEMYHIDSDYPFETYIIEREANLEEIADFLKENKELYHLI